MMPPPKKVNKNASKGRGSGHKPGVGEGYSDYFYIYVGSDHFRRSNLEFHLFLFFFWGGGGSSERWIIFDDETGYF